MATEAGISDDWEEVSDDGYSIVSSPDSDEDLYVIPASEAAETHARIGSRPPAPDSTSALPSSTAQQEPRKDEVLLPEIDQASLHASAASSAKTKDVPPPFSKRPRPAPDSKSTLQSPVAQPEPQKVNGRASLPGRSSKGPYWRSLGRPNKGEGASTASLLDAVVTSPDPLAVDLHHFTESKSSQPSRTRHTFSDEETEHVVPSRIDPTFFHALLTSLSHTIRENHKHARNLVLAKCSVARHIETVCNHINGQVQALTRIVSGYAHSRDDATWDIPLDPNLQAWASRAGKELQGLHDEMREFLRPPWEDDVSALWRHCGALWEIGKQMESFLPILQRDYDKYEAERKHNSALKASRGTSASHNAAQASARDGPAARNGAWPGFSSQSTYKDF